MRLLFAPELFPLMEADVCAVSSMSAFTYKRQQWSEVGKNMEYISFAVWCEIGEGASFETVREFCLKGDNLKHE